MPCASDASMVWLTTSTPRLDAKVATSKEFMGSGAGRASSFTMDIDDQAYLDQIEQNILGRENEQNVAQKEAQQRAAEMDRIRKATANLPASAAPKSAAPKAAEPKKNPLEEDPRYKEYFERLRRQKGEAPAPSTPSAKSADAASGKAPESQVVGPGAIVRFDDGSIGIYKDAVSGRDYALFYFLHPQGQFEPEGVFLQSYQAKVIGNLPENYFAELRDKSTWDRDLILFHLSRYEHVKLLDNVAEHEERKPRNTTPVRQQTPPPAQEPIASAPRAAEPALATDTNSRQEQPKAASVPTPAAEPTPKGTNALVKGRKFQIVFGGKKWEAVYWTSDENGAIVAHSTHGDWSLMRLDLERFKDSLELGDIADSDTINAIGESAGKG